MPVDGPFSSVRVPEDLEELRAQEVEAVGRVSVPRTLDKPHAGLVKLLRREEKIRQKAQADRWYWQEPVFDTPLGQRKLKLVNALFSALERRGHTAEAWEQDGELKAQCIIGDTRLPLEFWVAGKHRTEMIGGRQMPARDLAASTPLALALRREFRKPTQASWKDDEEGKLEVKLGAIVADIITAGEASFRQSLIEAVEWQEQQRKWEEERRQRHVAELAAKRLENLRTSGELLARAEEIRALVAKVGSAVLEGETEVAPSELDEWREWALAYADQIDPVCSGQVMTHIRPVDI